jgi:hypothetical protein
MKATITITTVVFGTALVAMPSDAAPYFLAMLAICACAMPLVLALALPVHALAMRRARRKAKRDFRDAYAAWKRALADPYTDASGLESATESALHRLRKLDA